MLIGKDKIEDGVTELHTRHDVGCAARVVALQWPAFLVGGDIEDIVVAVGWLPKSHVGL